MISVLIVHYNRPDLLNDCLLSLREAEDVVVVDNGSLKPSEQETFIANFPHVQWLFLDENLGFSAGVNHAARLAKGDNFLLLNPDTRWAGHRFNELEAVFSQHDAGILGLRQVSADGILQLSVGWEPTVTAEAFRKILQDSLDAGASWANKALDYVQSGSKSVSWVAGSALLTSRALFESLSGFDERYFLYFEDIDYCLRARKQGVMAAYLDGFETLHHRGACALTNASFSRNHYRDSQMIFFRDHGKGMAKYILPLWGRVRKLRKP